MRELRAAAVLRPDQPDDRLVVLLFHILLHAQRAAGAKHAPLGKHGRRERRDGHPSLSPAHFGDGRELFYQRVRLRRAAREPRERRVHGGESLLQPRKFSPQKIAGVRLVAVGLVLAVRQTSLRHIGVDLASRHREQRAEPLPRRLGHALEPPHARAAKDAHEYGLRLIVRVMGEQHTVALPRPDKSVQHAVAQLPCRLFQRKTALPSVRGRVHVKDFALHAALRGKRLRKRRILKGRLAPDAVFDVYGEKVRPRALQQIEKRDGIPAARKCERKARPFRQTQTKLFSRDRLHNKVIIKQKAILCNTPRSGREK